MAHFPYVRAPGTWVLNSPILPAEYEAFNAYVYKSINGDDGGTWAPAAVITIGGFGLTVTGPSSLPNVLDIACDNGTVDLTGTGVFTLSDTAHIDLGSGTRINVNSGAFIDIESGGDLDVKSGGEIDIESGGAIVVTAGGVVTVQSGGAISVEGLSGIVLGASSSISAASGSKITGALSQECRRTKTGAAARDIERIHDATADASAFFDCSYDVEFYTHTIATGVTHTLRISGGSQNPVSGDTIQFHIDKTGAGTVSFVNEGMGSSIAIVGSGTGHVRLTFIFRSTHWRLLDAWGSSGTSITPGGHA